MNETLVKRQFCARLGHIYELEFRFLGDIEPTHVVCKTCDDRQKIELHYTIADMRRLFGPKVCDPELKHV
jgi:hypothetical protein